MGNAKIQLEQYGCQGLTPNQMIIHASDIMLRTNSQNNEGPLLVLYHQNQGNTCYKAHLIPIEFNKQVFVTNIGKQLKSCL